MASGADALQQAQAAAAVATAAAAAATSECDALKVRLSSMEGAKVAADETCAALKQQLTSLEAANAAATETAQAAEARAAAAYAAITDAEQRASIAAAAPAVSQEGAAHAAGFDGMHLQRAQKVCVCIVSWQLYRYDHVMQSKLRCRCIAPASICMRFRNRLFCDFL